MGVITNVYKEKIDWYLDAPNTKLTTEEKPSDDTLRLLQLFELLYELVKEIE